MAKIKLEM